MKRVFFLSSAMFIVLSAFAQQVTRQEAVKAAVKDYYDKKGIAYDPELFREASCEHCNN